MKQKMQNLYEIIHISLLLIGFVIFGPFVAIYLTFFGDFYLLSKKYTILTYVTDEWELLLIFGVFWLGFYFMLSFWSALKKFLNKPPELDWWQTGIIYEIYVKSFKDSNNDGLGDLRGIIEKLDYLKSIGIEIIWLTPIYPSAGQDGGYDVTSYVDIDPVYGSMNDFDELVAKLHEKNMRLVMDFLPNHTSDRHEWFSKSCQSESQYKDYYVWYPSDDATKPPNNWVSVFGGSMWTYNKERRAWYLHQFLPSQPDLNLWSPHVQKELKKAISFWLLEKNVDGLRFDACKHLFESKNFENELPIRRSSVSNDSMSASNQLHYDNYDHTYTSNRPESYKLLAEWRRLFDEISEKTGRSRAMILEAEYDVKKIRPYYQYANQKVSHFPFNFSFSQLRNDKSAEKADMDDDKKLITVNDLKPYDPRFEKSFSPANLKQIISTWHESIPKGCWSNWQLGNHDIPRVGTRVGRSNIDLANAVNLLIGGTAVVYYGEEIGMEDLPKDRLTFDKCQDVFGRKHGKDQFYKYTRDYERSPMQWDNADSNTGFTGADIKTWLPVHPSYSYVNVQMQWTEPTSHLKRFRDLVELRKRPSFLWGQFKFVIVNDQIFSFLRNAYGFAPFLVVMNLSMKSARVNLQTSSEISPKGYVVYYMTGNLNSKQHKNKYSSSNDDNVDLSDKYKPNAPVPTKSIQLNAKDCLILTWTPTS